MDYSKFHILEEDSKVIFFLGLSEKVLSVFNLNEDKILASEALYKCWEWIEYQDNTGDLLYDLLDNEENGITISQEMSDNETDILAWNCIIDAVAFTSRKAFEKEGVKYFPEPIALVDDTLVEHFVECFTKCVENSDSYINDIYYLLDKYNNGSIKRNLRDEVLSDLQK